MTTAIDTPRTQLTTAQRTAALAWIERGESTLRDVAAQLHLAADELLDILTQPHVAAYIEAAESIIQIRTNILARYDDIEARQSLVAIAKNPEADHALRLRAAITILQGPPPRRAPSSTSGSPAIPGGPRTPALPTGPGTPAVPRGPGTSTLPAAPRPDRPTSTRPAPAPTSPINTQPARINSRAVEAPPLPTPTICTPARVERAAGASFARHDRIAAEPALNIPRPASPPPSARPP
jgi:hypothetical protein